MPEAWVIAVAGQYKKIQSDTVAPIFHYYDAPDFNLYKFSDIFDINDCVGFIKCLKDFGQCR